MSADQAVLFAERHSPGKAIKDDPVGALTLFHANGIGSARFRALLSAFGCPSEVLGASERALKEVPGIEAVTAAAIHAASQEAAGNELLNKLTTCAARMVSIWDESYPRQLKEIHDPPALLFFRGELPLRNEPCIAIVGTRTPSNYGMKQAHQIAAELAGAGAAIISGMARGIDTAAHDGALAGKGKTFAVFGCGIDIVYPSENQSLAERIAASGGLISEFLPGTQPDGGLFPRRNRIISGLCRAVLVIQGSVTSGAMITARCALEQNREVFALPGNVEDRRSRGPHQLLREGAILVESAADLVRELEMNKSAGDPQATKLSLPALNPSEEGLIARLGADPVHIDQLVRELNRSVASILADLLGLEMKGWVAQMPGKLFALKKN